jgi:ADP-ribose pyrophosphatase YjhB (NUDIX family)
VSNSVDNEVELVRGVIIDTEGNVVLHQRPDWSNIAKDEWQLIGGNLQPNEALDAAIQRKLLEELGLTENDYSLLEIDGLFGDEKWPYIAFLITLANDNAIFKQIYETKEKNQNLSQEQISQNSFSINNIHLIALLTTLSRLPLVKSTVTKVWEFTRDMLNLHKYEQRIAFDHYRPILAAKNKYNQI